MLRAKAVVETQSWCLPDPHSEPFREGVPTGSFQMHVPGQELPYCKPLGAEL